MNPNLERLHPYPFEQLAALKAGITPPDHLEHIALSIGEPRHPTPSFITEELITHLHGLMSYPLTRGTGSLRQSIADWLIKRFALEQDDISAERHVIPVNGTREALFAFSQCFIDGRTDPLVVMPNPFYQIYEGAALLAGAQPWFMNTNKETGYLPDLDNVPADVWQRAQIVTICSPANPSGAVMALPMLQQLIRLADEHDFIIASDECYSELYPPEDHPPPGLLTAAKQMRRDDFSRCMVFHSLSKRSNAPGLRSGFVAGDASLIATFLKYRTYHGCAMSPPTQAASRVAWNDEQHVKHNRELYQRKFDAVLAILSPLLSVQRPDATFYLWPQLPEALNGDDASFARDLFAQQNVTVLPGSFLSREAHGINPGRGHVRMALVAPQDECVEAAERIREYVYSL